MDKLNKYKDDLDLLVGKGQRLALALQFEFQKDHALSQMKKINLSEANLPYVRGEYQQWYTEALSAVSGIIPNRELNFIAYYEPQKVRKEIVRSNYTISDYLRGTERKNYSGMIIVDGSSALHPMMQQVKIIEGIYKTFDSSLFNIKTLMQADLFDNEIDAAIELNKKGFSRGAGAIAGVVLEGHLKAVCEQRSLIFRKKAPSISDYNDKLKDENVIEISQWRFIQHLGDIRNKCDHKKETDPTKDEVLVLIEGVRKITKTIF